MQLHHDQWLSRKILKLKFTHILQEVTLFWIFHLNLPAYITCPVALKRGSRPSRAEMFLESPNVRRSHTALPINTSWRLGWKTPLNSFWSLSNLWTACEWKGVKCMSWQFDGNYLNTLPWRCEDPRVHHRSAPADRSRKSRLGFSDSYCTSERHKASQQFRQTLCRQRERMFLWWLRWMRRRSCWTRHIPPLRSSTCGKMDKDAWIVLRRTFIIKLLNAKHMLKV